MRYTFFKISIISLFISYSFSSENFIKTTGFFNLDSLRDSLIYSDTPNAQGIVPIVIYLVQKNRAPIAVKKNYHVSESNIAISSSRLGEITVLESGSTGSSEKLYYHYNYNSDMEDWFLSKVFTYNKNISDGNYFNPKLRIDYKSGVSGIGGDVIGKNQSTVESEPIRKKKLKDKLFSLHHFLKDRFKQKKEQLEVNSFTDVREISEFLQNLPVDYSNVELYNNIAYYLIGGESESFSAIYILKHIIQKFPKRTVAFINLGDAYYNLGETGLAQEAYKEYIRLMEKEGKENKIPARIMGRME